MISTSPSVWFEDGNIVLLVEDTAFKVHRGQLARHSEIFQSLFSLPPPGSTDEYDGCQSVQMHGDAAQDWRFFLGALYDGLYFKHPRQDDFALVSSVLRLATKYFVEPLRLRCIARLEIDYPTTLDGWDQREAEVTDENGFYVPREQYPHPIPIIQLSMELGLADFLPSALYDLSRYGPSKIMEGTTVREQRVALDLEMVARVLRGRERGQEFLAHFILNMRSPAEDCTTPSRCSQSMYFITVNLLRAVGGLAMGRDADPLFTLIQAVDMLDRDDYETPNANGQQGGQQGRRLNICSPCKAAFSDECFKMRTEAWHRLPEWFGMVVKDLKHAELDSDM